MKSIEKRAREQAVRLYPTRGECVNAFVIGARWALDNAASIDSAAVARESGKVAKFRDVLVKLVAAGEECFANAEREDERQGFAMVMLDRQQILSWLDEALSEEP